MSVFSSSNFGTLYSAQSFSADALCSDRSSLTISCEPLQMSCVFLRSAILFVHMRVILHRCVLWPSVSAFLGCCVSLTHTTNSLPEVSTMLKEIKRKKIK